ncbi:MAG: DUF2953 domain-containing protein [Mobilitalea sp.]
MLHIILLILKIIGMILLVILGLLLLILLTVLLVPIRYRVAASHGDALRIEGRASWLLHLIHASFSHIEGVLHIRMRIFGFILYDNHKPKSPKIKKQKKTVKRKAARITKTKTELKTKTKAAKTDKKSEKIIKEIKSDKNSEKVIKDLKSDTIKIVETHYQPDKSLEDVSNDELLETPIKQEHEYQDTKEEKISFLQKIILKLKGLKDRITAFFQGLKIKIIKLFESAVNIKQKASLVLAFIKDEFNRDGFHITYHSLKKLLKHILPTKLRSRIVFGTGDPCTTGQALGIMSILYSFYGDKIQITPDFENKRFEGKHDAKGRIRLITILIIVIKLMLDKRFKQLKRNFLILKEAL